MPKAKKQASASTSAPRRGKTAPTRALLEDLAMRFVLNAPAQELSNPNRILFLIEQAWWHYEDFSRKNDPKLHAISLKLFAELLYSHIPQLKKFKGKANEIYKNFIDYKFSVPCAGAILLNPELVKVLLVKGMGKTSSWGVPKGKVNAGEKTPACATREVEEEIGVNISSLIDEKEFLYRKFSNKQETTLYIIPGISEQTHFATYTRGEISEICWHPMGNLLPSKKNMHRKVYWGIGPFYSGLVKWINKAKRENRAVLQNSIHALHGDSPGQRIAKQYAESDDEEYTDAYGTEFTSIESLEHRLLEQAAENIYGRYDEKDAAAFEVVGSFSSLRNFAFEKEAIYSAF